MPITKPRKCEVCKMITFQTYYDDYRSGKLYAYWQCEKCGTCFYKCPVHGTWTGDGRRYDNIPTTGKPLWTYRHTCRINSI
jgi:ferredoxin